MPICSAKPTEFASSRNLYVRDKHEVLCLLQKYQLAQTTHKFHNCMQMLTSPLPYRITYSVHKAQCNSLKRPTTLPWRHTTQCGAPKPMPTNSWHKNFATVNARFLRQDSKRSIEQSLCNCAPKHLNNPEFSAKSQRRSCFFTRLLPHRPLLKLLCGDVTNL